MKRNSKGVDRFTGYSTEDCDCKYCLHYAGKSKPCPLETCCCDDERSEAAELELAQARSVQRTIRSS